MAHAPPHSLGSVPSDSASKGPKQFGTWQSQRLLGLACSPAVPWLYHCWRNERDLGLGDSPVALQGWGQASQAFGSLPRAKPPSLIGEPWSPTPC